MSNIIIPAEHTGIVRRYSEDADLITLLEALDASSVDRCVSCDEMLGGLLGSFQWGIVHGHGECSGCGFPYVYYHYQELSPHDEIRLQAFVPNAEIPLPPKAGEPQ